MSFNELAEKGELSAWASWMDGRPTGYYDLPNSLQAAEFYRSNGYLVLDQALSPEEISELKGETTELCLGERGSFPGLEIRSGESPDEALRRYLCIHMPHKVSTVFRNSLSHYAVVSVLTKVVSPNVKCMQSMVFIKGAGKPGQAWHQDEIYIPTRDRSLTGAWIALDDATVENGCLWVLPGSHRAGVLYPQEWHADPRFDCAFESKGFPYSNDDAVPVEVKAGSIVFFHGYTLHRSLPNRAISGFRRAVVNHYMSAESLLPWDMGDLPTASADNRDIVMVAGEDPYAWKGVQDRSGTHVRPSGEGGCGSHEYNRLVDPRD